MTLQDLGSLAEVVGAVATVGALIYLAIQIRASTIATRAEARRASFENTAPALIAIAESEELARIWNEGIVDFSKLNSIERTRFSMVFALFVSPFSVSFDEARIGVGLDSRHFTGVAALLRTPGGRQWWRTSQAVYHEDFQRYVEREVLRDESTAA
jgi:hypothetical protein